MHCTKLHKNLYSVNTHANNGHYKTDTCCKKSSFYDTSKSTPHDRQTVILFLSLYIRSLRDSSAPWPDRLGNCILYHRSTFALLLTNPATIWRWRVANCFNTRKADLICSAMANKFNCSLLLLRQFGSDETATFARTMQHLYSNNLIY